MKTYLLVDGTNIFIRGWTVNPSLDSNGNNIGGIVSFLSSLKFYTTKCKPSKIIIAWDGKGGSRKRREVVKDYKEGRRPPKLNRNFEFELDNVERNKHEQRIKLLKYLDFLPVHQILIDDTEADDIIAYLVNYFSEDRKIIVSSDRDFYQLLDDKTIIFLPIKKTFITTKECINEYNIHPNNFAIAKAMVGDRSDNIKGIKGVGFKKVVKFFPELLQKEKVTLEHIFSESEKKEKKYLDIFNSRDIVIRNHRIMQLKNPLISIQNISKIRDIVNKKNDSSFTQLRVEFLKDGITNFDDNFISAFKYLKLK